MIKPKRFLLILVTLLASYYSSAQISPGELSVPHEFLEGVANCTKCHILGEKITGDKCLECHSEINERIISGTGYHSSPEVKGKQCISCHSEHHGRNFQIVKFSPQEFNHNLSGFSLSAPHSTLQCQSCHVPKFISDRKISEKKFTYLGLKPECLTCHTDYHLGTLSPSCLTCHAPESFKAAPLFNHDKARFKLTGRHRKVECVKCHRLETIDGRKFQEFRGVAFSLCSNCHQDPHKNKYGQNCRRCHTEESFSILRGMSDFNHDNTDFPLRDRHINVDCKACHKTKFTDPLKHDNCFDCHTDYHKGEFSKNGVPADCSECHDQKGFNIFAYTIEQHNKTAFRLNGSHTALPCSDCHRKMPEWSFRNIGRECRDCHPDIHKTFIDTRYYPQGDCLVCHNESGWKDVAFDHSKTGFPLTGAHIRPLCATCHITRTPHGPMTQKFSGLPTNCSACHTDIHQGQFTINGAEQCSECHVTENWTPSKFNHNTTAFKLDGKHTSVPCSGCHKPSEKGNVRYTVYKIEDFRCESCHL